MSKNSPLNKKKRVVISVSIVDDKEMISLNKKYLNKDNTTDVLSFSINDENKESMEYYLGDVVINKDQAKKQAKEYGNSVEQEIADLSAHGVLHLLGVHHDGDDHE